MVDLSVFVIRKVQTGFKFDLKAPNGETVLTSEVYTSAAACRKGIGSGGTGPDRGSRREGAESQV